MQTNCHCFNSIAIVFLSPEEDEDQGEGGEAMMPSCVHLIVGTFRSKFLQPPVRESVPQETRCKHVYLHLAIHPVFANGLRSIKLQFKFNRKLI